MHVVCFSDLILIAEIRQFMTLLCLTQTCVPTMSICSCLCRLLDMYLKPGEGREPMHGAAVRLLHCHGASLDPLQVLEALSADMPLPLASQTIARMMRARVHRHRQGQIVKNLERHINLEARVSRVEERSRHVCITNETACANCRARIGTKLFALYPNDCVVCYKVLPSP
jgi:hypothetical protein